MKRTLTFTFCVLYIVCLFTTVGCASSESAEPPVFREIQVPYTGSSAQYEEWSLEKTIDNSSDIFTATFTQYVGDPESGSYELEFAVGDVIRGDCKDDTIYVYKRLTNWTGSLYEEYNYVEGHEYMLILNRRESVYYDHDIYLSTSNIFIPLSDAIGAYMDYKPLAERVETVAKEEQSLSRDILSADNIALVDYVETVCISAPEPTYSPATRYTKETELSAILPESEYVLLVEPFEHLNTGASNTETFMCSVSQVLVGENVPEEIYFTFFTGTAEIGGRYYIAANRSGGKDSGSDVFVPSSKNSVIVADNETRVQELFMELGIE